MTEAEGFRESLHPTLIVNCVANAFLSFTAIVLNVITIKALRKTPSLSRTLKTLLLNLTISDLGVGLLVQPLYVASLVMENEQNTNNIAFYVVRKAHIIQRQLFVSGSFLSVFVLTVDRFLAIHLHLRYQELVTHKRVVTVVVSTWVFRASITFLRQFYSTMGSLPAIIVVVCMITTGLLYCKIYAAVRHHTNQIHVLQVQQVAQNGEMPNAARQRKMAVATFYVYVVYLVCYLPVACIILAKTNGETVLLSRLEYFTLTLAYLNSSLNPVIYCWKMRHIRQTVMVILRNIFPSG